MVIVFGASGFIGTYLTNCFIDNNWDVTPTDVDPISKEYYENLGKNFICCDISNPHSFGSLPKKDVSCVVNLACLQPDNIPLSGIDNYSEYFKVNVIGILNILKYCVENNIPKIIHVISHRGVSGLWKKNGIISEKDKRSIDYNNDFSMFSISELAAVDCLQFFRKKYSIEDTILRIPAVFGYGPHLEGYKYGKHIKTGFQTFIDKAIAGETIEIWGNPSAGRNIVYVKDVVLAIISVIEHSKVTGLYNISSGTILTLEQEVRDIISVFAKKPVRVVYKPEKENGIECCQYSIDKARKYLGWSPEYTFKEMLEDYKYEMNSGKYEYLIKKRKDMLKCDQG